MTHHTHSNSGDDMPRLKSISVENKEVWGATAMLFPNARGQTEDDVTLAGRGAREPGRRGVHQSRSNSSRSWHGKLPCRRLASRPPYRSATPVFRGVTLSPSTAAGSTTVQPPLSEASRRGARSADFFSFFLPMLLQPTLWPETTTRAGRQRRRTVERDKRNPQSTASIDRVQIPAFTGRHQVRCG